MDLIFSVKCKKESMECVMNLPHFGEMELICDRREDFDDREESFLF